MAWNFFKKIKQNEKHSTKTNSTIIIIYAKLNFIWNSSFQKTNLYKRFQCKELTLLRKDKRYIKISTISYNEYQTQGEKEHDPITFCV